MPIFDQFDIATNFDYSGSYTDNIIKQYSGSLITDKKFIGSKTETVNSGIFGRFFSRYSDAASMLFTNAKGKNNSFVSLTDEKETFYDSLVPSPLDLHILEGGEIFLDGQSYSGRSQLNIGAVAASSSFTILISNNPTGSIPNGNNFFSSFPFESKYRSLLRLKNISNISYKTHTVVSGVSSGSSGGFSKYALPASRELNYFAGNVIFVNQAPSGKTLFEYLVDYDGSVAVNDLGINGLKKMSDDDINNDPNLAQVMLSRIGLVTMAEVYKLYFGTQRKFQILSNVYKTVDFVDYLYADFSSYTARWGSAPKPAGWKYGLYNAMPTKPNAVFRRNHFGHYRDMLEQRLYTKFDNGKTTTSGPVMITFISGTDSYITATNSSVLNIKDSGMFRREYTSGRPFADDL